MHTLSCWYLSGLLLLSHLILRYLITTVLNLLMWRGGGGSFFFKKQNKTKKKKKKAPYESSILPLSLSKHKDHYKSIKVCHV